jgi:hypothetical protein
MGDLLEKALGRRTDPNTLATDETTATVQPGEVGISTHHGAWCAGPVGCDVECVAQTGCWRHVTPAKQQLNAR